MQQNAETLKDYVVNVAGSKDSTSEEFGDHPSVHCIKIKNYNLALPRSQLVLRRSRQELPACPHQFCPVKLQVLLMTSLIPSHVCWYGNQATWHPFIKKHMRMRSQIIVPFLSFQLYPKYTRTFCLTRYTLPYLRIFLPTCLAFWRVTLAVWL